MDENKKSALSSLIKLSLELLNATQGAFLSADDGAKALKFEVVAVRHGTAEILGQMSNRLVGQVTPYGDGVTGRAAITQKPQVATRSEDGDMVHVRGDGIPNAVVAVPVVSEGELLGVLTAVCFDSDLSFSNEVLRQYQMAAVVAAVLLKN